MPHAPDLDSDSRELIAEFLIQADLADLTLDKFHVQLREWATWLNDPRSRVDAEPPSSVRAATTRDIQRFLGYLRGEDRFAARPARGDSVSLSASSRKNHLSSLRSLYRYLTAMQIVERDPTTGVRSPKVRTSPGFHLEATELEQLLSCDTGPRGRIIAYLLVFTAARANELRCLRWDDIDLRARTIALSTKGGGHHIVDIHPRLLVELRRWNLHQGQQAESNPHLAAALVDPERSFVLLTRTGRQLAKGAIAKQLKRRAVAAGLHALSPAHNEHRSKVSPHAIRRSVATMLLNGGEPIDAVADVLHHRQLDTTRRHYAFASNQRRKATIEAILQ